MVLFDLADAEWFPLVMIAVLGGVMYLLYLSMRHEMRKIRVPRSGATRSPDSPSGGDGPAR